MMKKLVKIAAAATAALAVGGLLAASMSAPLQVETLTLRTEDAVITYTGQGSVIYDTTLELTAPVSGEVLEVLVTEGQAVKAGDPIALLSTADLDYQVQRLEADIRGYQAQISNLNLAERKERDALAGTRGELEGQLAALEAEKRGEERAQSSLETRIRLQENMVAADRSNVYTARQALREHRRDYGSDTSDLEYTQLRAALNDAEKGLLASEQALLELESSGVEAGYYEGREEGLRAQLDSIDTQLGTGYGSGMSSYYAALIESAQLSIQELSERQGKAGITAPYDCVISRLHIREEMTVTASAPVVTVGRDPVVEVLVPAREMDGVGMKDPVSLTLSKRAGDQAVSGWVVEIAGQAQIQLSPLGVEESKVRVLIAAEEEIPVGSQADVEFTVYRQESCLTVPQKAIFQLEGQDSVWVVRDGEARVQSVAKGTEVRGGYVVDEGVREGDVIVADANLQGLSQGKRVAQVV